MDYFWVISLCFKDKKSAGPHLQVLCEISFYNGLNFPKRIVSFQEKEKLFNTVPTFLCLRTSSKATLKSFKHILYRAYSSEACFIPVDFELLK